MLYGTPSFTECNYQNSETSANITKIVISWVNWKWMTLLYRNWTTNFLCREKLEWSKMSAVATSEEQQVATEVQGVRRMGESQKSKPPPKTTDSPLSFVSSVHLCLLLLAFSEIWHGVNGCGKIPIACNVVCLSHADVPFSWAILLVDYYENDFFLNCTV